MAAKSSLLPILLGGGALLLLMSRGGGKGRATGKGPAYSPDPLGSTGGSKPEPSDIPVIAEGLENAVEASRDARGAAEAVSDLLARRAISRGDGRRDIITSYITARHAVTAMELDLEALYALQEQLSVPMSTHSGDPVARRECGPIPWGLSCSSMFEDVTAQLALNEPLLQELVGNRDAVDLQLRTLYPLSVEELEGLNMYFPGDFPPPTTRGRSSGVVVGGVTYS